MITASDAMPTTIPMQREPNLNHVSIAGSNEIPTDPAVANIPAIPALNEFVSIILVFLAMFDNQFQIPILL